jgi:hypothetical protein
MERNILGLTFILKEKCENLKEDYLLILSCLSCEFIVYKTYKLHKTSISSTLNV